MINKKKKNKNKQNKRQRKVINYEQLKSKFNTFYSLEDMKLH